MYISAREIINILDQITINFIIVLLVSALCSLQWVENGELWSAFYSFV